MTPGGGRHRLQGKTRWRGADEDEALLQAVDALESALSFCMDARKPLPAPSKAKRELAGSTRYVPRP